MPAISPFMALRYPQSDLTPLVSPPYDVLSGDDKSRLLAQPGGGHNIVSIDLPHIPPKEAGPDAAYEAAGHILRMWRETGILVQDDQPALYPYQQTYTYGGGAGVTYKRRGFFCRVRLEEFDSDSSIHPHEQTFSGPKEDRLKLMRATQANLSPVFGLYDDKTNDVTDLLFEAVGQARPLASAHLPSQDGKSTILSELWAVTDLAVIKDIRLFMGDKHVYIADGHHRYTTCLNYRRELSAARGLPLEHNDSANFALFTLIAMQDPGLIILPTHRVVAAGCLDNFFMDGFCDAARPFCKVMDTKLRGDSLPSLERDLATGSFGPHAVGVYDPVEDAVIVIQPREGDPLGAFADDPALAGKSAAWRQLDVAILQHLIFERILAPKFVKPGAKMTWAFPHEAHEVAALCRNGAGEKYRVGFLLQPTPLSAVRELCNANELMPQKSTFFYPKLATGLVINPLT